MNHILYRALPFLGSKTVVQARQKNAYSDLSYYLHGPGFRVVLGELTRVHGWSEVNGAEQSFCGVFTFAAELHVVADEWQ